MIRYLEDKAIDRAKWDALITDCGSIYAQSWYLDVVHPQWEALVCGDYEAVMPLTGGKKFGVNYLFQPFFAQQLGVFSRQDVSPAMLKDFLDAIPKKYRFAEIRMNEKNSVEEPVKGIEYHRNILLDLNQDIDSIHARYHANAKRNLKKSESFGLQIIESADLNQIIKLFREDRGANVGVWGDAEYATLLKLAETAMKRNAAFTLGMAENGSNEMLCGALFMQTESRVTFLFSGNSQRGKETQSMTFMLNHVIQHFANQPFMFDFEGSDDDNLARFYLGFGGEAVRYPSFSFNRLPGFGKTMLRLWKSFGCS